MMREYFDNVAGQLAAKIAAQPELPHARRRFALETARLGQRLFSATDAVAWCGVPVPFDLLRAMDVHSCFIEFVGAMMASAGAAGAMLQTAETAGYFTDSCAYHRAVLGAALNNLMPVPDFLIGATTPCAGGLAALENLARHFRKDLFVLHFPYDADERSARSLAAQLVEMTQFVAAHTGRPLDPDRLRAAVEKTNAARALMIEVYDLARRKPSPLRSNDLKDFGIVMPLFFGSDAALEIAQAWKDELTGRLAAPAGPPERLRLLWIQNRVQFKNPLIAMFEDEYRAKIVADELNDIPWGPIDPDEPYLGLARRMLTIPLHGALPRRIERLVRLAREYQADGAVNPCHWGCRQGTGAKGLIQRALRDADIPVINLEVDCIDPRNFAEGQLRTRLEAFFEMLG
jgi:benzoyl-CoA reductase/2-hydroxyglutaryl-CoA dehydratase subunit BcrC/BadD/HgdB